MFDSKWVAGFAVFSTLIWLGLGGPASARASCGVKAGDGTGATSKIAKYQAYEALLQATDWGAWACPGCRMAQRLATRSAACHTRAVKEPGWA